MNWGEVIDSMADGKKVVSLATATTGLHVYEGDELIGVCVDDTLLLRKVDSDLLLKSQAYHGITDNLLREKALDDDTFRESLARLLDNTIVMTYNVDFQEDFLMDWCPPLVYVDLPLAYKGAASQMAITDGGDIADYLKRLASLVRGRVGFKRLVESLGICADPSGTCSLPVELSACQICQLYERLRALPAIIQARLV